MSKGVPGRRVRVGILISGRGSNMAALIEACRHKSYPAEISVVISNRPKAVGLVRATEAGIPALSIDHTAFPDRASFEDALTSELKAHSVEWVCNAGFMRLLTGRFVDRWHDRHLNIHPSLLPAYRGLDTHARVLADGVLVTGCTVHVVREAMDAGPIVAQAAVPVCPGDTPDTLASRVLAAEHQLYPLALRLMIAGMARIEGDRVVHDGQSADRGTLFVPPLGR